MSKQLTRSQKAAATRARNKQKEQEEEVELQRQVQASGARHSKRHAEERWAPAISKRQKGNTAAVVVPDTARTPHNQTGEDDLKSSSSDFSEQDSADDRAVDDEGGQEESDNDDLCSVGSQQVEKTLASEAPMFRHSRSAQQLFDDDEEIEFVPALNTLGSRTQYRDASLPPIPNHCCSSSAHSGSSHTSSHHMLPPPSSDEEDPGLQPLANAEQSTQSRGRRLDLRELSAGSRTQHRARETAVRERPPQETVERQVRETHQTQRSVGRRVEQAPTQAGRPVTNKTVRQQKFDDEAPTVQKTNGPGSQKAATTAPTKAKANVEPEAKEWPPCAQLVLHPKGRSTMRLNDQSIEVRRVIQHAIKATNIDIIYRDAFPDPAGLSRTLRKAILSSARSLAQTHPQLGYKHIKERIKYPDHDFTDAMAKPVVMRYSTTRGDVKEIADDRIVGYNLTGEKELCKARVRILLQDDNYIYPGDWDANNNPATQRRQVDEGKLYASLPMIACMRALCKRFDAGDTSDIFVSTIKDFPKELELPPGLVALAATTIFAVLRDWQSGELERLDFEGNIYSRTYKNTLDWFSRAREHNATNYHRLMHGLYRLVLEQQDDSTAVAKNIPVAKIDLITF